MTTPAVEQTETAAPTRVLPQPTPVTYAIIGVCVAIFAALHLLAGPALLSLRAALMPSAAGVRSGAVWGLLTSAFVHLEPLHLAFNLMWARHFGRLFEPHLGRGRYLAFVAVAAIVGAGWQLLLTGSTGIGFSGVVYAFFGYTWARRRAHPTFEAFLPSSTIQMFLGWLLLCIVLTVTKIWNVGNAAHITGLASGWLLGVAIDRPQRRPLVVAGAVVLAAGVALSLVRGRA